MSYKMNPGSKQKNTKGNFSEKESKKINSFKNFKSDMGDYNPTITSTKKTLGGDTSPYETGGGRIKKAGESLARGGKVLSTKGRTDKRDKTTRQTVREVSYKS